MKEDKKKKTTSKAKTTKKKEEVVDGKILDLIKYIVIHCTAGFGGIRSIEKYWKEKLKWNGKGYNVIIDLKGQKWYLNKDEEYTLAKSEADFSVITNGVKGFNDIIVNIAYIGGVENVGTEVKPKWKAKDTRTGAQKRAIVQVIYDILAWLDSKGIDITKQELSIVGHRDFSPDKNNNGKIESWERVKECPSYEAIEEHKHILNNGTKLPTR